MKEEAKNKLKKKWNSTKGKRLTIALVTFTIGNAFALSAASFAWFCLTANSSSTIQTFSGDLDVSINKVSALKYVYPYHRNSTEFVDYDSQGTVKSYVVQDSTVDISGNLSNKVVIELGINQTATTYATSASDANIGATKVHYENSQDFNYYLIGDSVFNGVSNNPWSTLTATCFSRKDAPALNAPVSVNNVVVSSGAEFVLFDARTIDDDACQYFTYESITPETNKVARFSISQNKDKIKCLKSGIYKFDYRVETVNEQNKYYLDITIEQRSDDAIIGSNLIDPTKITIDYRGSASTTYKEINDYLPVGINEQNTMVVFDVELQYQNKNPIDAGLKIIREEEDYSIFDFDDYYNTTDSYTFAGYVDSSHRNQLCASDFYAFHAVFAKEENAYSTPAAAWQALHTLQTGFETDQESGKQVAVPLAQPFD